jgi:transcriptional regulator with XRE-family HTH domain
MTDRQPRERRDREAELNARICQIVREKRLGLGLLQAQVAAHLSLAESTFSRYESGQRVMPAAMLCRIAAYLRQPIAALVPQEFAGGDGAPEDDLQRITQALWQRPDLTPTVVGLLETLLADKEQPNSGVSTSESTDGS